MLSKVRQAVEVVIIIVSGHAVWQGLLCAQPGNIVSVGGRAVLRIGHAGQAVNVVEGLLTSFVYSSLPTGS